MPVVDVIPSASSLFYTVPFSPVYLYKSTSLASLLCYSVLYCPFTSYIFAGTIAGTDSPSTNCTRKTMALTDIIVKNSKPKDKSYKLPDGKGLHLLVHKNGVRSWRFRYRFAGKENMLSLGNYPECTLKEARDKCICTRKKISDGIDPSQEKKIAKLTRHINAENSFENISREWHDTQKTGWTERHASYVLKRIESDLFPSIGFRPINEITAPELLATVKIIEKRGALDIASRVLQTSGQIFRYAIATGRATHDISADLRGALTTRKKGHFNKLPEKELPEFLQKLEEYDGEYAGDKQTKLALKMIITTFVRTGELRGARWEEFNLEKKQWRIPASRMKMDEEHIVPLSKQTLALLEELRLISGNRELLFPNRTKPMTPISENTLLYALYRMGYRGRTTTHGFRATASTVLHEKGFPSEIIELQLSHAERNKVKASYNFAKRLPERHELMQWWADYIDRALASAGHVVEGKVAEAIS